MKTHKTTSLQFIKLDIYTEDDFFSCQKCDKTYVSQFLLKRLYRNQLNMKMFFVKIVNTVTFFHLAKLIGNYFNAYIC